MRLATWNLNNRIGKVCFQPEAAVAAVALGVDLMAFTEYYPKQQHERFCQVLADSGWVHQIISPDPGKITNRALIASRLTMRPEIVQFPGFDPDFVGNTVAAFLPDAGLRLLGVRVECFSQSLRTLAYWHWLERVAVNMRETPSVILGDLNSSPDRPGEVGDCFRRILKQGWQRAAPRGGCSYFGLTGGRTEVDHILFTRHCSVHGAEYVTAVPGFILAGTPGALSDHAALVAEVEVLRP
jgi:hypothetical protein